MALEPSVRRAAQAAVCTVAGFLGSAASLGQSPQPLAMGLITAVTGWRAVLICLGAMAGYPLFWGMAGSQGVVWSAAGGLLTLLVGNREERKDQPLMIPALAAVLTAVAGLCFRLLLHDGTPVRIFALRVVVTFFYICPVWAKRPVPGPHHRLAVPGPRNLGSGPGRAGAVWQSGLCRRGGGGGGRGLPRGSPGRAGAGFGPGQPGAHDGGAVPGLLHPADSL